jgi:F-type H+-transporting ATPase subunit delta
MNESKIAVRYAKALFLHATESNQLDQITKDIRLLHSFIHESADFKWLVHSPIIPQRTKSEIFRKMFAASVSKETLKFLELVLDNNRELHIPAICRNYLDIYRTSKGIQSAHFITAVAVDDATIQEVKKIAEEYFSTLVEMFPEVKPELIGGYMLRVGDQQLDASVTSMLEKIRRSLISTDFEVKY